MEHTTQYDETNLDSNNITKYQQQFNKALSKIKSVINFDIVDCAYDLVDKEYFDEYNITNNELGNTDLLILATICGAITPEQSKILMNYGSALQSAKIYLKILGNMYPQVEDISKKNIKISKEFLNMYRKLKNGTATTSKNIKLLRGSSKSIIKLAACSSIYDFCYNKKANKFISEENICVLIPKLWTEMVDIDKYKVGKAYYFCYCSGMTNKANILKDILICVNGLDYIPRFVVNKEVAELYAIIDIDEEQCLSNTKDICYSKFLEKTDYSACGSISWLYITALLSVICSKQATNSFLKKFSSQKLAAIDNEIIKQYTKNILPYYSRMLLRILSIQSFDDILYKMIMKLSSKESTFLRKKKETLVNDFCKNILSNYISIFKQ